MDIHTALFQAHLLYNVDMGDDDFEEIALIVHKMIGNKNTKLYRYKAKINHHDLSIELPCNFTVLESVNLDFEDWNYTSDTQPDGDWNSSFTEQYVESRKPVTNPLYPRGKYIEYEKVGNKLYFRHNYGHVHILYKGEVLDENGLPDVNDKEINAIATYVAYVYYYKEALQTKNQATLAFANDLKRDALTRMDEARTPEYASQNDMNEILDVKSSWNRKVFNKSYKPIP